MTSTPNPTWYDVLGVPQDASADQIKAAWREATDKFEPGTGAGMFRVYNEAADVLLDPDRRRKYDETLGAHAGPSPSAGSAFPTRPVPDSTASTPSTPATHVDLKAERRRERDDKRAVTSARRSDSAANSVRATRRAGLVALVLTLLTALALATVGYFGLQVRKDARIADARDQAPAAAEQAAEAVLAYDYQQLEKDRERASEYLTASFEKKYLKNFALLEKQPDGTPGAAVQTKTVVKANVLGSGVMDAGEDTARVLVYVNQVSEKPGAGPQVFQNRVAVTMKKVGKRWLVDDLKSY